MAGLLGRKKKKKAQLELNGELPFFDVHYLGRTLTKTKMGRECTRHAVSDLVKKAQGRELQTVSLTISSRGIWVTEKSGHRSGRETFIPIYSVTYGAADKTYQNVFTIVTNYRPQTKSDQGQEKDSGSSGVGSNNGSNGDTVVVDVNTKGKVDDYKALKSAKSSAEEKFVCHAFLCRDPVLARAMVVYLLKAFKVAFEAWSRCLKSEQLRERIKAGPGVVLDSDPNKTDASRKESRKSIPSIEPSNKPPEETTALVDKVAAWMDRWFHIGTSKKHNVSSSDDIHPDLLEFEEFSRRMQEFSDPTVLNFDVDIEEELKDVEVCSVLNDVATREPVALEDGQDEPSNNATHSSGTRRAKSVPDGR
ncbi:low density lipoprotein receptor adapter protein 1-B-like [Asterias rubens]|uniref:low density lipoprotein receptor adapter protein 1-B-like n=1 Tax=Asterias rubens TaxID=7604 RepID=UPI0014553018|nr:low density lipoprotein receptor adapter protein 1-B-like [Asterias rubens]